MNVNKMLPTLLDTINLNKTMLGRNDPPEEIFAEDLPYLPLSDPHNTRDWKFSITFSDEFDGATLDTSKWYDYNPTWVGRTPSYFKPNNVRVENSNVILRSNMNEIIDGVQTYDASTIKSKFWSGYGYYEARTRTSQISMTSSFWFRGNGFEIDVYEQVGHAKKNNKPTLFPSNLHEYGTAEKRSYPAQYDTSVDLTLDYHVYGLEYGPDFLKFYFDGQLVRIMEPREGTFNVNLPIIFDTETFHWKGFPEAEDFYYYIDPISGEERYTGDFHIDYIRVWKTDTPQTIDHLEEELPVYKTTYAIYGTPTFIGDPVWANAVEIEVSNITTGGIEKFHSRMSVKTMWDEEYLYILTDVKDQDQFINSTHLYDGDNIDLYFDFRNKKAKEGYPDDVFSIKLLPDGQSSSHKNAPPFKFNTVSTKEDYQSFIQIPWGDFIPEDGSVIGFDAQLNEGSTEAGKRVGIAFWNSTTGNLYKSMYTAGNLKLIKYQATIL